MEQLFARLAKEFERGTLNRRQLIQGLAAVAAAAYAPGTASAQDKGFHTRGLDHISYQVADYRKTRGFYADLMDMSVSDDNGRQAFLHVGDSQYKKPSGA